MKTVSGPVALLVCAALLSACSVDQPGSTLSDSEVMPVLERVPFELGADTLVWAPGPTMAVLAGGVVAIPGSFGPGGAAGGMVQLIAAAAETLVSLAPRGEAPGEVIMGGVVQARSDTLLILDQGAFLLRYNSAGQFLGQSRLPTSGGVIIHAADDSVDLMALPRPELLDVFPAFLWRQPLVGEGVRSLIPADEAQVTRVLRSRQGAQIPVAIGTGRIALADPWEYSVVVYSAQGQPLWTLRRNLPQPERTPEELAKMRRSLEVSLREATGSEMAAMFKRRLDTLAAEFLPHLSQNALHFDAEERLWVIGRVADSTFVDLFRDSSFVGRITLPCARPERHVAMDNQMLALLCEEETNPAVPWRLQLYRIKESRY